MKNTEKSEKKIKEFVKADLNKQEEYSREGCWSEEYWKTITIYMPWTESYQYRRLMILKYCIFWVEVLLDRWIMYISILMAM